MAIHIALHINKQEITSRPPREGRGRRPMGAGGGGGGGGGGGQGGEVCSVECALSGVVQIFLSVSEACIPKHAIFSSRCDLHERPSLRHLRVDATAHSERAVLAGAHGVRFRLEERRGVRARLFVVERAGEHV